MNQRRAGYSLFEVLIAFAILTMVLSALIPGQAKLLSRVNQQDEKFLAQDYAYSRMAQVGVTGAVTSGASTDSYRDWHIVQDVSETVLEGSDVRLFKITIDVQSKGGETLAQIETLRRAE